jgi:hypothetical protein
MVIGTTMLQQVLTAIAVFVISLLLLAITEMLLAGNTATGLGHLRFLCPMFLIIGFLWIGLAVAVRLLI